MGELLNERDKSQIDRYVQEIEMNALNNNRDDARKAAEKLSNFVNGMQIADKREEAVARINLKNRQHVADSKTADLPSISIVISGEDTDKDTKIDRINGFRLQHSGDSGQSPLRKAPSDAVQPLIKRSDVPNERDKYGAIPERIKH